MNIGNFYVHDIQMGEWGLIDILSYYRNGIPTFFFNRSYLTTSRAETAPFSPLYRFLILSRALSAFSLTPLLISAAFLASIPAFLASSSAFSIPFKMFLKALAKFLPTQDLLSEFYSCDF